MAEPTFDEAMQELENEPNTCQEMIKTETNTSQSCSTCGAEQAKYRCPGCMRRSCCLQCVKQHKTDHECNGLRCKTAYVPKKVYNENNFMSDYYFLEETNRVAYNAVHDSNSKRKPFFKSVNNLQRECRRRGINLHIMPVGMSRRKENNSFFDFRQKKILWRVKWLFHQSDEGEFVESRVSEDVILKDLLSKYVDPQKADPITAHRLKSYIHAGQEDIHVFLKQERFGNSPQRFYRFDLSQTLKQFLQHKVLVEYPVLHVVLGSKVDDFPTHENIEDMEKNKATSNISEESGNQEKCPSGVEESCVKKDQDEVVTDVWENHLATNVKSAGDGIKHRIDERGESENHGPDEIGDGVNKITDERGYSTSIGMSEEENGTNIGRDEKRNGANNGMDKKENATNNGVDEKDTSYGTEKDNGTVTGMDVKEDGTNTGTDVKEEGTNNGTSEKENVINSGVDEKDTGMDNGVDVKGEGLNKEHVSKNKQTQEKTDNKVLDYDEDLTLDRVQNKDSESNCSILMIDNVQTDHSCLLEETNNNKNDQNSEECSEKRKLTDDEGSTISDIKRLKN